MPYNVSSSWYQPRAGRTFVLRDSGGFFFHQAPPANLGPPSARFGLGDGITLYVYPYDVASRFNDSDVIWSANGGAIRRHVRMLTATRRLGRSRAIQLPQHDNPSGCVFDEEAARADELLVLRARIARRRVR